MAVFQPPPTWALPVILDETTGKNTFNPIWLKWFVDLAKNLGPGGAGSGSVSSVNASGGATGLTFSGGPITTSGTLTLSGTLDPAHGGFDGTQAYARGSFTVATGYYSIMSKRLALTGAQRATLAGTARLRIT